MYDERLNANLLKIHAAFPRVGKALELYWGEKEFQPYINKLLADNRDSRKGFPFEVMLAIMDLQQLHDIIFPELQIEDPDEWTSSQFGIR